jgi:hypothetical protein
VPDAIHAAAALQAGCRLFMSNDPRAPGLTAAVLDELLTS